MHESNDVRNNHFAKPCLSKTASSSGTSHVSLAKQLYALEYVEQNWPGLQLITYVGCLYVQYIL